MSNSRKTQGDIDKLIKKIQEGIEEYEVIYDKFAEAPNAALKERFEGDLKKEIKKLQRLREQVKTLVQSPDVKDKKALEGARRRVEEKMEAFKVVERETKTKAFSKEGLANLSSNNTETPQQRTEMWIKTSISELKEQIETCEFELHAASESGGGAGKRRKKKDTEDPKETRLLRLRVNTLKLEQLLRLVVNEDLQADEVDEIEEDVQRYIDENMEEDFEEDEDLYERFDLPDVPVRRGTDSDAEEEEQRKKPAAPTPTTAASAAPASTGTTAAAAPVAAAKKETAPKPAKGPDTPPTGATASAKTPMTPATAQKTVVVPAPASKKNEASAPAAAPAATNPTTPATPFGKKTVAAVVAAAAAPSAPAASKTPSAPPPKTAGPTSFAAAAAAGVVKSSSSSNAAQFPALAPAAPSGIMGSGLAAADDLLEEEGYVDDDAIDGANDDTFGDDAMPVNSATSLADMAMTTNRMESDWDRLRNKQQQQGGGGSIVPPRAVSVSDSAETATSSSAVPPMAPQPAAQSPQQHAAQPAPATSQVWSALLKAQQPSEEKVAVHRMLDMSLTNLPHPHDVERVRPFVPPNPYQTKPHHPQSVHPGFSSPDMFRKFDPDTLFFIFYYQQQTYQQYLAAKELKRQSFRYHKKFKTWFQRHDKPKESTEEFESGAYLYFDYENGWCQRIKNDFVFKYAYLEDELV